MTIPGVMGKSPEARPPRRLIDDAGDARYGVFSGPVEEINGADFQLTDPFDRPVSWLRRYFSYNQFQFIGALSPALVLGCAIVDIRYVGTAFVYLFEPSTRRVRHFTFRTPLALGARFAKTPERGVVSFRAGRNRFTMTADPEARTRALRVELPDRVEIDLRLHEDAPSEPMRVCTRTGPTGWVYTRKAAGLPVTGRVRWEGGEVDLAAVDACGGSDWSAGYMRRETFWLWGCLSGRLADGRRVGLNAVCGVNESGVTENCFWLDGRRHKLDTVQFEFDRRALGSRPWRLRSYDGRLDLEFVAEGSHREALNAWLLASNFTQLFGRYRGALTTETGERVALEGVYGYLERHFARW
ncbi:MAG: DUF2804 domain-containing protein [Myxococcales bacterium]|nr:DUF2804 domain-containing protein [Myxococcales bacterium]MCB9755107.1 DUF2804 domain-containing protein [Myxococcales bacterium]